VDYGFRIGMFGSKKNRPIPKSEIQNPKSLMGKSKIRITQMLKRLLSVLTCTAIASLSGELLAQLPEQVRVSNSNEHRRLAPQACSDQSAGSTVRSLGVGAKSNDKHFLCAGDSLMIVHQGNQNLTNDITPATLPGIGYGFYDCLPTISGTRYYDIRDGDPCWNRQTIVINGVSTPPLGGIWVSFGQINGNHRFVNDGRLQTYFNNNRPKKFYFAPITVDNFDDRSWNGNSCTNANTRDMPIIGANPADTFSVVYLNKIVEKNISYNYGTLTGQFNVSGGLSEYDGTSSYSITVQRTSNNAILGTVTSGVARHNSNVSISVPQAGTYTIIITDGKSCDRSFTMHFPVIQLMVLNDTVPRQGDTSCVKVAAKGFNSIISMESNFTFNRTLLNFTRARNFNLPNMDANSFSNTAPGIITMSWNTAIPGATRADSTALFELCFETLAPRGTFSDVKISDTLNPIEVTYNNADPLNRRMGVTTRNGGVFIGDRVFAVSSRTDSVRCFNGFDGRVIVSTVGGAAPLTYNWAGPGGTNGNGNILRSGDSLIILGLAAGTYTVTIVDNFGARRITSATVGEPAAQLFATLGSTNIRCFGDTTGILRILSTGGGTVPYRFSWSSSADSVGSSISRLRAGAYAATVTDARGCTYRLTDTIGVPRLIIGSKNSEDAACVGVNNGIARINSVTGGSIPNGRYVFQWSNGVQHSGLKDSLTGLMAGRYFVTVSDNNNCQVKDSFTLIYSRYLTLTVVKDPITCAGQNNGILNVTAASSSGIERAPYTFTWSSNAANPINTPSNSVVTRLGAGTYTLTTRDLDNCRIDTSFVLTAPDSIRIDTQGVSHESCTRGGDGVAQVRVTGGTPGYRGYRYSWNGSTRDTFRTLSGLVAGTYTVVVKDSLGCMGSKTVTILVPQKPIITRIDTVRPTCYNSTNGRLIVRAQAAVGGGAIRSYTWSTGAIGDTLFNVGGGVYTVTVTDANGCSKVDSQRLTPPNRMMITIPVPPAVQLRHPSCPTRNDGQITLPVTGGAGGPYNYSYAVGNSQTGAVFSSLTQGRYRFTITDRNNCSIVDSFELKDPDSIKVVFSDYQAVSCFGICNNNRGDGSVLVRAYGGTSQTGKYGFRWSSNEITINNVGDTSRAVALCQGRQWVNVKDDQNVCEYTYPVTIPARDSFRFDSLVITPPSCNGKKDGSASLTVRGGTPSYSYSWTDSLNNIINSINTTIVNVGSGSFTLLVRDSKQCTFSIGLTINQPNLMKVDTVSRLTTKVTCHGLTDGQIGIRRRGGNAGRTTYTWSTPNGIDSLATNLKAGSYSVTATDVKGCRDSLLYTVSEPDSIYFFMQKPAPPRCNGLSTTLKVDTVYGSKRIYPFLVQLDNGAGYPPGYPISTFAGTHQLTIVETTTGCSLDTTVTITEPPAVKVDFDSIPNNPQGQVRLKVGLGDSIRLNPRLTNSVPIDSVIWTPKTYLSFKGDPLRPWVKAYDDITYKLTVIDANGCSGFDEVVVELERNRNVFVPNVFTPNGDDQNDFFQPFTGLGVVKVNYMRVFDRWGALMFQLQNLPAGQDANVGWDGTFNGKKVDSGVYVYIMEVVFEDGQILLYRGDVNLLR
jgi:gliding motility-associated-like protein